MNEKSLFRFAGWSAYVSAAATIIGAITLVIFFSVGDPFGVLRKVNNKFIVKGDLDQATIYE